MSIGTRPFVQITRPLMEAYAAKVGADLHVVDSLEHVALREHKARLTAAPLMLRFLKLPLLDHFLGRYWQVLYLDDDTLVGPRTPDLFAAVPCGEPQCAAACRGGLQHALVQHDGATCSPPREGCPITRYKT